ncbi:MAG: hypothetical protein M3527_00235 [Actinomycetota bacterium]|nr:hypothetical protein [Acidimicrobiia bacterium]MDQ3292870.1 hypothetical protein [Actinomycetota bacterium]
MSWEMVQNAAQAAWHVIKDGEPHQEISTHRANAVPAVDDWQDLGTGFYSPKKIRMTYEWPVNVPEFMGRYVYVDAEILLRFDYGATYKGGGAFIPSIWLEVPQAYTGWSWNLDIDVRFQPPTNANPGDRSRPIARIPVTVSGTVSTYEHRQHLEWGFTLYGNGSWVQDT